LKQVNIHFVIYEENYEECLELFHKVQKDRRFAGLNAIVLLALKKCGRAKEGGYNRISDEHFKSLVDYALEHKIGIGFDSCSCNRFVETVKDYYNAETLIKMSEPCESLLFSQYINVNGIAYPCSFNEHLEKGFDVVNCKDFLTEYWNSDSGHNGWRIKLLNNNRLCPSYDI